MQGNHAERAKHAQLIKLLKQNAARQRHTVLGRYERATTATTSVQNTIYVLFLEPHQSTNSGNQDRSGMASLSLIVDYLIKRFDVATCVSPHVVHCELLIPPSVDDVCDDRVQFATYLGAKKGAGWQRTTDGSLDPISYYLMQNGARWRALPISINDSIVDVRTIADEHCTAPYSLLMYVTSTRLFRGISFMWSERPRTRAHCGVITARVLRHMKTTHRLPHSSAWYSPSSLYNDVLKSCKARRTGWLDHATNAPRANGAGDNVDTVIDTLLYGHLPEHGGDGVPSDSFCAAAVKRLTDDVYAAVDGTDKTATRLSQVHLATALLKWVLLRDNERNM